MSAPSQFSQVLLSDIFKHLAAGLSAGTTVVTPNRRLALALKNQFDEHQVAQQLTVWDSADILPFSSFVERIYKDALYSENITELPVLLTATQVCALWEAIIGDSDNGKILLSIPQTAKFVHEAWKLAHAWQLFPALNDYMPNDDGKAFQEWVQQYELTTKQARQTDEARLCDLLVGLFQQISIKKPKCLICYGFDTFSSQQINFLIKLAATGCEVMLAQPASRYQSRKYNLKRIVCNDSRDEIYRAAVWARARIEDDNAARIGIAVPSLTKYRSAIVRIFSSVMVPDVKCALSGAVPTIVPFNISLGKVLTSYPLIDALFQVLALVGREIEFERVSLLLRSPYIEGGETEMSNRALLDARLRKRAEPVVTLKRLLILIKHEQGRVSCPVLMRQLAALVEFRQVNLSGKQLPSTFAKIISELLGVVGFPGERGLDSIEYQTLKKWREVIAEFAAFDAVVAKISYDNAMRQLCRLAAETLFQPETPEVPIQILGVLEAAGLEFDHLWVMGLSDEVWPLHPHPNPFLPIESQRQAKLPEGSVVESLAFSQRLTNGWLSSADEVILSHPQQSDERDGHALEPSSLIKHVIEGEIVLPVFESHRDRIQCMGRLEVRVDDCVQIFNTDVAQQQVIAGGTAVLKDYAACPFRALVTHRLKAESLSSPHTGLNAMERGTLVHHILAYIWQQLGAKSALDEISIDDFEQLLKRAADGAIVDIQRSRPTILSGRFAEIERRRLVRLAREWLEEEKKRGHFTVIATEEKRIINIGGLTLSTRLDRVDELDNGLRIIIDYKTQQQSVSATLGERLDEPQLPLYLVMAEPDAVALAFAQVKMGTMGFAGIARESELLPGVKFFSELRHNQYDSWEALVAAWRAELADLATGFFSGNAMVDPKNYPQTCRYCDIQPFCRIQERVEATLAAQDDEYE